MSDKSSPHFYDPPVSRSRTLVLCFDGTTNEFDGENTNVVKFFSLLQKGNCDEQLCYYQAGVGTYFAPGVVTPVFEWVAKITDMAVAWYLSAHVMDGYKFVMQNYRPGDKICVFGFSRGAYTARALAGMLSKIGLLTKDNEEQVSFAYKLYARTDKEGVQLAEGFKDTFCAHVRVEFVGVWDTVASVGVLMGKTLPFTNSNTAIKTFRHAVSLDERRAKFKANLFHRGPELDGFGPEGLKEGGGTGFKKLFSFPFMRRTESRVATTNSEDEPLTDVLEVWFAGCHSDVGGGSVPNDTPNCLGNIPLRWMVHQVIESQCGILFRPEALGKLNVGISMPPGRQLKLSKSPGIPLVEASEDADSEPTRLDAVMPAHDELSLKGGNPLWWILEVIPLHYTRQDAKGVWHTTFRPNFGQGRNIEDEQPKFHESVKIRLEDANLKYKPKAIWKNGSEIYVK